MKTVIRPEDPIRVEAAPAVGQARGRAHLLLGPVGAGKSSLALELARAHAALSFTLDEWMTELFSPDRPAVGVMEWYAERANRSIDRMWKIATSAAQLGIDVIFEVGLLRRAEREKFYERANCADLALTVYVLDAPREIRRQRVEQRNHERGSTFAMVVPPEIFDLASDLWEPLDASECVGRDVRFVRTDVDSLP